MWPSAFKFTNRCIPENRYGGFNQKLFETCSKWNYEIKRVDELVIDYAFFIATSGRPGPVVVSFPVDIQLDVLREEVKKPNSDVLNTLYNRIKNLITKPRSQSAVISEEKI